MKKNNIDFEFTSKHGFLYTFEKPNVMNDLIHEMKYQVTVGKRRIITTHVVSVWLYGAKTTQEMLELLIQELNEKDNDFATYSLLPKRIDLKVNFENGDHLITGFNGTMKEANNYYVGKQFNVGSNDQDQMVKVTSIERIYTREDIKLPNESGFNNPLRL